MPHLPASPRQLLDLVAALSDEPEQRIIALARAAAEVRRNRDRLKVSDRNFSAWTRGREAILDQEELSSFNAEASAFSDGCAALLEAVGFSDEEREEFQRWQAVGYLDVTS